MKVIGAVLVMVASCGIGFLFASELKKRKRELEEQYSLMSFLLGDIRYMRDTLSEAVSKAITRHKGSYTGFLKLISDMLCESSGQSLSEIWGVSVEKGLKQSSLSESDKQRLRRFGEEIAFTDSESIIMHFEEYLRDLKEEIDGAGRVVGTKVKLYRSLGILAGMFIVVLFI